jgi:hypothetical protein
MESWELVARERVRDTLARYTWAGDGGRAGELALAFCEDGVLHVRDQEPVEGRAAIAEFIGGVEITAPPPGVKRIVRHNVTNIRFTSITPDEAKVESYFTVLTEAGLDHHGRYRDTFVPVGDVWLIRLRFVSTDWRVSPDGPARSS